MLLKRFHDTKLAQASYLVGCAATGEAPLTADARASGIERRHAWRAPG